MLAVLVPPALTGARAWGQGFAGAGGALFDDDSFSIFFRRLEGRRVTFVRGARRPGKSRTADLEIELPERSGLGPID
jgi:hypothetical protein